MIHKWALAGKSQRWIAAKVEKTRSCVQYVLRRDVALVAAHGRIALLRGRVARFFRRRRVDCGPTYGSKGSTISIGGASKLPIETLSRVDGVALVAWFASVGDRKLAHEPDEREFERSFDRVMRDHLPDKAKRCESCGRLPEPQDEECRYCGWEVNR